MVKIFQKTNVNGDAYISHVIYNGDVITKFDSEIGLTDLNPLKDLIGHKVELYVNDKLTSLYIIKKFTIENGFATVILDDEVGGEG